MKNVRSHALQLIQAIDAGKTAQAALAGCALTGSSMQFCTDLVYGVLRTRLRLKQALGLVLPNPRKLPEPMLILLEMALYSCQFQANSQPQIVCNDTTSLIKRRFGQRLANVANAALRKLLLQQPVIPPPSSLEQWADHYAMPLGIARLWAHAYGEDQAIQLMKRAFQRPFTGLRVAPAYSQLYELLAQMPNAHKIGQNGLAFPPGSHPATVGGQSLRNWQRLGALSYQAPGSLLVLEKLKLPQLWDNVPIWDACAGFGGKTTALLEAGLNIELASDIHRGRLTRLAGECNRLHLKVPSIIQADTALPPFQIWRGNILADIPCSGLGVLNRRPDIKLRWEERNYAQLLETQLGILTALSNLLHCNGELAVITCTLNPAENEDLIANLTHTGLTLLGQWQTPADHPWLEGMFGARLIKTGDGK